MSESKREIEAQVAGLNSGAAAASVAAAPGAGAAAVQPQSHTSRQMTCVYYDHRSRYGMALEDAYNGLRDRATDGDLSKTTQVIDAKQLDEKAKELIDSIRIKNTTLNPDTLSGTCHLDIRYVDGKPKDLTIFALAKLLRENNPDYPIHEVCLSYRFSDDELIALTQALRVNTTLRTIRINRAYDLGDVGCVLIALALEEHPRIRHVDIECATHMERKTTIGDLTAMAFAKLCARNPSMEYLLLKGSDISEFGLGQFYLELQPNNSTLTPNLKQLDLSGSNFNLRDPKVISLVSTFNQNIKLIIDYCSFRFEVYPIQKADSYRAAYKFKGRSFIAVGRKIDTSAAAASTITPTQAAAMAILGETPGARTVAVAARAAGAPAETAPALHRQRPVERTALPAAFTPAAAAAAARTPASAASATAAPGAAAAAAATVPAPGAADARTPARHHGGVRLKIPPGWQQLFAR